MESLEVAACVYRENGVLWAYVGGTNANLASQLDKSDCYHKGAIVQACGRPRSTDLSLLWLCKQDQTNDFTGPEQLEVVIQPPLICNQLLWRNLQLHLFPLIESFLNPSFVFMVISNFRGLSPEPASYNLCKFLGDRELRPCVLHYQGKQTSEYIHLKEKCSSLHQHCFYQSTNAQPGCPYSQQCSGLQEILPQHSKTCQTRQHCTEERDSQVNGFGFNLHKREPSSVTL